MSLRLGLVQLRVTAEKALNLQRAKEHVQKLSQQGAKIVTLAVYNNLSDLGVHRGKRNASTHRTEPNTFPSMRRRFPVGHPRMRSASGLARTKYTWWEVCRPWIPASVTILKRLYSGEGGTKILQYVHGFQSQRRDDREASQGIHATIATALNA